MNTQIIERVRITTPLGLRFRDSATDELVRSGLRVTARLEDNPQRMTTAQQTSTGVYAFHHLPELRDIEYSNEDLQRDDLDKTSRRYIIRVNDPARRFLTVAFVVSAPQIGIFPNGAELGSPSRLSAFDLFSNPARHAPPGFAQIRADLIDNATDLPAAYALLEVEINGQCYYGLSDLQGKIVVLFPYPAVEIAGQGSPILFENLSPLHEQEWNVKIHVYYDPNTLEPLPGIEEPNLRTILEQSQGVIYPQSSTPTNEMTEILRYAQTLVLRTSDQSYLKIGY